MKLKYEYNHQKKVIMNVIQNDKKQSISIEKFIETRFLRLDALDQSMVAYDYPNTPSWLLANFKRISESIIDYCNRIGHPVNRIIMFLNKVSRLETINICGFDIPEMWIFTLVWGRVLTYRGSNYLLSRIDNCPFEHLHKIKVRLGFALSALRFDSDPHLACKNICIVN
jgi:hypothetical protein